MLSPVFGIAELGFCVVEEVLTGPLWVLVTAQHNAHLSRREGVQLAQREHMVEPGAQRLHLPRDTGLNHELGGQLQVVFHIVKPHLCKAEQSVKRILY